MYMYMYGNGFIISDGILVVDDTDSQNMASERCTNSHMATTVIKVNELHVHVCLELNFEPVSPCHVLLTLGAHAHRGLR